ncbi:glutathione-dependent formaldehyde dehydrogenase [Luteibacter aegosomatis]|uniref:zinc-dependent alcohol dehydrogenase n=1 Tax=Luteibacter aegosomatis TaxID=2911537 RepID=UPI001FF7DC0D|nr:zinc-dependent alcohol dehydrogenase [Luteibacter aegosomatis]UPG87791.1 glutathione-dependent formaldehyde dehydrogenase [Luteibacter aegosomatis]
MKAIVFHALGDIRLDEVSEPTIESDTDAVVRLTRSAICGTDLHFIRGTMAGVEPGTILGHEGVGIVESLGDGVRNFKVGDRVVVPSTIGCGYCSYCRAGYYAQCDNANPNGPGTAFYGGPKEAGGLHGMQAEKVRVPFANVNLVKLPEEVSDDEAILISDIFPTGYFGADMAGIKPGHTVAVFGCGPVGQFAIASAKLFGAGRVFAVDRHADRLDMAREQGAETVDFSKEDPVETIKRLTGGIGADSVIDAVGVDAEMPHSGPAEASKAAGSAKDASPSARDEGDAWRAGDGPAQALTWAVDAVAKAGTISIIGVYPPSDTMFPIGAAMNKNLTVRMGNCNHRKYVPMLVELVRSGQMVPTKILTQREPMGHAIEAYERFDHRQPGWIKVELEPSSS